AEAYARRNAKHREVLDADVRRVGVEPFLDHAEAGLADARRKVDAPRSAPGDERERRLGNRGSGHGFTSWIRSPRTAGPQPRDVLRLALPFFAPGHRPALEQADAPVGDVDADYAGI